MKKGIMVRVLQLLTAASASVVVMNGRAVAKARKENHVPALKIVNLALGCAALGLNVANLFHENKRAKRKALEK